MVRSPSSQHDACLLSKCSHVHPCSIMSPLDPSEKHCLDEIVDKIIVPIRSSSKAQFPRCSFIRGITNLTVLAADERGGVAFILTLVAASKSGSDMLTKAATRIKDTEKRVERVNAENDDDGNQLEELYADSFVNQKHVGNT